MKAKEILKKELSLVIPLPIENEILKKNCREAISMLKENIRRAKISAEIFVGGSFAKGTLIKKDKYDIDLFARFDTKKYKDKELSKLLSKIVPKNSRRIHGSRDYFSFRAGIADFEIIPVLKIKKPEDAENITDLSYFHVKYAVEKIKKNPKLSDEIRLAKAFLYYQGCYGAESYIRGFSGYAVELLIIHYKSFLNFARAVAGFDIKKEKLILDPSKLYKNKGEIMRGLNESKLLSPIIVIDPTFKERNALAALSFETFLKFRNACIKFIRNPRHSYFFRKDGKETLRKKHGKSLIELELSTEKQSGDIAGTKLKKFSSFFLMEAGRFFIIKNSWFSYDEQSNKGNMLISAIPKKEIVFNGPPVKMIDALKKFRKEHRKIRIFGGKSYACEKPKSFSEFLNDFISEKQKIYESMGISHIKEV